MQYTLGQAAKAVGKNKSTISRSIKNGRISATRTPQGQYVIDAAELFRVYPQAQQGNGSISNETHNQATHDATAVLQTENEGLRRELARLEDERNDLRRRLDQESEERRKLTMMLTYQPPKKKNALKKDFWHWLSQKAQL